MPRDDDPFLSELPESGRADLTCTGWGWYLWIADHVFFFISVFLNCKVLQKALTNRSLRYDRAAYPHVLLGVVSGMSRKVPYRPRSTPCFKFII